MNRVAKASEFAGSDTVALARRLIGTVLAVRRPDGTVERRRITETEAYHGGRDRASHASRGRTARNAVMFGPGGRWYVYLCYGMHEMLNLVTGPEAHPAAVLIRGVEGAEGPGRLTKLLGIGRRFNGSACDPESGLWIEDDGGRPPRREIVATPRVGVDYAGPYWKARKWRFVWTPVRAPGRSEGRRAARNG